MEQEDKILRDASQVLQTCRNLSQRCATFCNRIIGENDAFAAEVKGVQQNMKKLVAEAKSSENKEAAKATLSQLEEARKVLEGLGPGGDLRKFCKPRNPWLIRLLLGEKISVVAVRRDVSQGIREEYHRFRDQCSLVMFFGPLLIVLGMERQKCAAASAAADAASAPTFSAPVSDSAHALFSPWLLTAIQMYMGWLSYFYLSMALRENVLLMNGSHIKSWWVTHHYLAAMASLFMLGLPITSPAVNLFFKYFLYWSVFQAVVMYVQNRYQRRRMYTRIALGRNTAMDVVAGESSGSSAQLRLLFPMLFVLQLSQFLIGAGVAVRTFPALLDRGGWLEEEAQGSDLRGMRGVCIVGCSFAFMAYMNFQNTLISLLEKRRYGRRARAERQRTGGRGNAAAAATTTATTAAATTTATNDGGALSSPKAAAGDGGEEEAPSTSADAAEAKKGN